jgi:hypothetical protein
MMHSKPILENLSVLESYLTVLMTDIIWYSGDIYQDINWENINETWDG